jgi:predicted ester cyclase
MSDAAANRNLIERFDELLNTQALGRLDQLCAPDLVNHALAPGRPAGLAGTREFLAGRGRQQWRMDAWRELTTVAEGDYVVQYGIRAGRWPGGSFRGFQIPAGDYTREVAFMYRIHGGRVAERWAVRDDLGMMLQLGALTAQA